MARTVTGLAQETTYHYRLRAQSAGGTSDNSGTIAVTTAIPDVPILEIVENAAGGNGSVNWTSVSGAAYDIYQSQSAFGTGMSWTKVGTALANAAQTRATLPAVPEGYFRVVPAGMSPNETAAWAVVKPLAEPGFSLMSPGVRSDGAFDGTLGTQLAEVLQGSASGDGDKVHIKLPNNGWRTLWLDENKLWREADGETSTYRLPAGAGFFVERKAGSSAQPVFAGPVGNDGTKTNRLVTGFNLIGLSEGKDLPIKATFQGANPQGGAVEEEADQLVLQKPDGSWRKLMYIQGWGAPYDGNWFDLTTFQIVPENEVLEPGAAYYYFRNGAATDVKF
jgi:hypothetical protein